jgi:type IV secretory pathway VirB2 component (pilin)
MHFITFAAADACKTAIVHCDSLPQTAANSGTLRKILDVVFGIVGAISVLIVVIAGFRYITAHGDPKGVAQARNAITYAVVGLLVSLLAFSIVTFVLGNVG